MPDLLEEKLRSQLEEEKKRCPSFLPTHPDLNPAGLTRDDVELPRTGKCRVAMQG